MTSALQMDPGLSRALDLNAFRINTVSRGNTFGLYLTLGFCLLAQPYGSLLYPKPRSVLGRIVFFFWRLNPISTLFEVVLLSIALADGIGS